MVKVSSNLVTLKPYQSCERFNDDDDDADVLQSFRSISKRQTECVAMTLDLSRFILCLRSTIFLFFYLQKIFNRLNKEIPAKYERRTEVDKGQLFDRPFK